MVSMLKWIILLLCWMAPAATVHHVAGKVVRIVDGDTVDLLVDRTQFRLRLYGIDAPERGQPFATVARQQLGDAIAGAWVRASLVDRDRYGRFVARIEYNGKDASEEMVRAGLAWWYRTMAPRDRKLERLESEARKRRKGLWSQPATPPWEWRKP
jgi:endonuclease YncB( thermonuclease family)